MASFNHVCVFPVNTNVICDKRTITRVSGPLKTFGDRLKWARKNAGFKSQQALADACKFKHQSVIGNMESGRNAGARDIITLARVLKVSPEWLQDGKGEAPPAAGPQAAFRASLKAEESIEAYELIEKALAVLRVVGTRKDRIIESIREAERDSKEVWDALMNDLKGKAK